MKFEKYTFISFYLDKINFLRHPPAHFLSGESSNRGKFQAPAGKRRNLMGRAGEEGGRADRDRASLSYT